MIEKTHYNKKTTKLEKEVHKNEKGEIHQVGGPAVRRWHANGQKCFESWCQEGVYHRLDGPAREDWDKNGEKYYKAWYLFGAIL